MTSIEVPEETVSATCHDIQEWVTDGGSLLGFALHHPRRMATTIGAIGRLPRLEGAFSRTAEGRAVEHAVHDGRVPLGPLTHKSVLVLPDEPGQYAVGPAKQTVRRKTRKATKLGVRWKLVESPDERRELVRLATSWERTQPDDRYRKEDADNDDLLQFGLWLVAYREPGEYLLLCVAPVDGEWAYLRHYRTIGVGDAQSEARYLLMEALVDELVRRGVRYLLDGRARPGCRTDCATSSGWSGSGSTGSGAAWCLPCRRFPTRRRCRRSLARGRRRRACRRWSAEPRAGANAHIRQPRVG